MKKRTEQKIVVVTRETRIDGLKKRFNSVDQLSFYVKRRGGRVEDYLAEDTNYKQAIAATEEDLSTWGNLQFIDRSFLPNYVFGPNDTVVAIGQDGLVANTLKYLRDGQPLIGVNPDPERWDGVLLPFRVDELEAVISEVLAGNFQPRYVTMAQASLNDGQEILAVNDFFIGQRTHTSARYMIRSGKKEERHSSSGVIVSTGLGSTGWLKSLVYGASAAASEMAKLSGHDFNSGSPNLTLPWDTERFYFTVREPFPSRTTQSDMVFGTITRDQPLIIRSLMPENGVIFSDGVESDFLEFNSGAEVTLKLAQTRGVLVS